MNGNVTKNGIAKDMAWMKRVGIGGLQNFDADLGSPQIVAKRLVYMHPDWKDAFHFAAQRADALGLELAIASSPGWSETGGPWVKPQDGLDSAMKLLSEGDFDQLPVVDNSSQLVGMLTRARILRWLQIRDELHQWPRGGQAA